MFKEKTTRATAKQTNLKSVLFEDKQQIKERKQSVEHKEFDDLLPFEPISKLLVYMIYGMRTNTL